MSIEVTGSVHIDEGDISERFIHASGPGGQNVNKVATAVQLRFDVANARSLPDPVRERLVRIAGRRVNSQGELIIEAKRFRSLERNRKDARERLAALVRRATLAPKPRKPTRPSRASIRRLAEAKRRRSAAKRLRRPPPSSDD